MCLQVLSVFRSVFDGFSCPVCIDLFYIIQFGSRDFGSLELIRAASDEQLCYHTEDQCITRSIVQYKVLMNRHGLSLYHQPCKNQTTAQTPNLANRSPAARTIHILRSDAFTPSVAATLHCRIEPIAVPLPSERL